MQCGDNKWEKEENTSPQLCELNSLEGRFCCGWQLHPSDGATRTYPSPTITKKQLP
jgi:hypothetical protein